MRSRPGIAALFVIAVTAGAASANGRFPSVISGHFQQGSGGQLIIGATFGGVYSKDLKSFDWMCEKAIGYGGFFDPEFALSSTGVLFASTFDGLARSDDSGYKSMAVVVLDEAGHLKAAQRADGASMFRVDVATGKAWAAVGMGLGFSENSKLSKGGRGGMPLKRRPSLLEKDE